MRVPKQYELTLNSETFAALKADFDLVLKKTLSNMQKKGSDSAEVKVSLKIALSKAEDSNIKINDLDGMREVLIPRFDHKVASVLQIKDEASGTLSGNFELVFDENRKSWIMREIIGPQTSLEDYFC